VFYGEGILALRPTPNLVRARCWRSSGLSPGTCPVRLNLPGTAVPADVASRVPKAHKPPHHDKVQHFGRKT